MLSAHVMEEQVIDRILASKHFRKAPLLSAFLSYVYKQSWNGARVSEKDIGVEVFGRDAAYDPREDNIVRNYARQLRRRLNDFYVSEGQSEALRVEIPRGGYLPVFRPNATQPAAYAHVTGLPAQSLETEAELAEAAPQWSAQSAPFRTTVPLVPPGGHRFQTYLAPIAALSIIIVAVVITISLRSHESMVKPVRPAGFNHLLWTRLFSADRDTLIVPADAAFVTVQDMQQRTYSLSEYVGWLSVDQPNPGFVDNLKTRKYTSVVALEISSALQMLPEYNPTRSTIRTSRNLRVDDLKDDNLILMGSVYSIPWIELLQDRLNFRLIYKPADARAWISNLRPLPGEPTTFYNHWSGAAEQDYAVITLLPNLNRTGSILIIEGLDGAGTEAAKDVLFQTNLLQELLKKTTNRGKAPAGLEVLIESTNFDSKATNTRVLLFRTID